MITQNQILNASDEELPRLLGEVLQLRHKSIGTFQNCVHCNCNLNTSTTHGVCKRPIPLSWDNAMEWRDWAVKEYGRSELIKSILAVLGVEWRPSEIDFVVVAGIFALNLKPKHYIQAAAICKLNAKEIE